MWVDNSRCNTFCPSNNSDWYAKWHLVVVSLILVSATALNTWSRWLRWLLKDLEKITMLSMYTSVKIHRNGANIFCITCWKINGLLCCWNVTFIKRGSVAPHISTSEIRDQHITMYQRQRPQHQQPHPVLWSSPLSHRYFCLVAVLWLCCGQSEVANLLWWKSDYLAPKTHQIKQQI